MGTQILLGILGFGAGVIIASGGVSLIIGLGIIPRYAGVTRTAEQVLKYETACILGGVLGNLAVLYTGAIPFGSFGLALYGISSGIFLGSWIVALGEVVNTYAILVRRLGLVHGIPLIIAVMALAKTIGSLLFFWKGWW